MESKLDVILRYIKDFFATDYSGHDFWHSYRVYKTAKTIAKSEKCDEELVIVSALLHDVDDHKIVGEQAIPFENAKKLLKQLGYDEAFTDKVTHIISQVSFKGADSVVPDSIEGKIVQDADRLDAIGAIGIARTFAFGGSRNRQIYDPNEKPKVGLKEAEFHKNEGTTINHFYEKLLLLKDMMNTETAKKIAIHRHEVMEQYLDEFYKEWEGEL